MDNVTTLNFTKTISNVSFTWYDYSLFIIMLGVSTMIGIYFGYFGKKQTTAKEYLLGGKKMATFPVAMSLLASQISGLTLLAVPTDIYFFGITYCVVGFSITIATVITYYFYYPVFHKLQVTSTYEYLKIRFDKKIQILASIIFTSTFVHYLPLMIYIPALAFTQATGMHIHVITPIVCGICIFYTTIGGLKAVVWTDAIQVLAMIAGIVAVIYIGTNSVGGITEVWNSAKIGERLAVDFDFSLTKRDTFWAALIGLTGNWICFIAIYQYSVQKLLSLGSLNSSKKALVISSTGIVLFILGSGILGLIIYAKYKNCDPLTKKQISAPDQLISFFVMDVTAKIPGLPGLFLSGIFFAALSTLSASMNCLAATIFEDFVSPYLSKNTTQKTISNILKLIVVIIGVFSTAMVFVIEKLGGLLPLTISLSGTSNGPLVGLFSLGMFVPWANAKGALWGGIAALLFNTWMVIGNQWYKAKGFITYKEKPTSIIGCSFNDTSTFVKNQTFIEDPSEPFIIYRISYYYYTLIGIFMVFIIALPVSWLTKNKEEIIDKDLISPPLHWMLPKLKDSDYVLIRKDLGTVQVECELEK